MKNVSISMDDKLLERVRLRAAEESKSLSRFLNEVAEIRVGKVLTQKEALQRLIKRPLLDLTIDGKAPARDSLYD